MERNCFQKLVSKSQTCLYVVGMATHLLTDLGNAALPWISIHAVVIILPRNIFAITLSLSRITHVLQNLRPV